MPLGQISVRRNPASSLISHEIQSSAKSLSAVASIAGTKCMRRTSMRAEIGQRKILSSATPVFRCEQRIKFGPHVFRRTNQDFAGGADGKPTRALQFVVDVRRQLRPTGPAVRAGGGDQAFSSGLRHAVVLLRDRPG